MADKMRLCFSIHLQSQARCSVNQHCGRIEPERLLMTCNHGHGGLCDPWASHVWLQVVVALLIASHFCTTHLPEHWQLVVVASATVRPCSCIQNPLETLVAVVVSGKASCRLLLCELLLTTITVSGVHVACPAWVVPCSLVCTYRGRAHLRCLPSTCKAVNTLNVHMLRGLALMVTLLLLPASKSGILNGAAASVFGLLQLKLHSYQAIRSPTAPA